MASRELILGGQRSGKSRCAEARAAAWLAGGDREAVLLATAQAGDGEMRERIARHRADRPRGVVAHEVPFDLAEAIARFGDPRRMVLVDCLTLWLTNLLMPMKGRPLDDAAWQARAQSLYRALESAPGPVVLVSNEIGLGLSPLSAEARRFVDELGRLHQAVAARCDAVTFMVAGLEMPVKRVEATGR
jgi:adenosylcobinamide kinase/adenosylcobinamide-phosphate guanylyltransferase